MKSPNAKAWSEPITIPTYPHGAPDPNPMFLEKRVYQGSSGAVYPYPVIDKIFDDKADKTYNALFLENEYLKIMILPELGGRIQMALDKTNDYHFVYYNRVIKPALVGLIGPWISGGIEFNWPQHHRPSTFLPVEHKIEQRPDGSAVVWISEIDRMHGTRMLAGFTLYPDKAYLEINVKLYNRTSEPQTFLWWANPACAANDNHQSVFPPDVHAVMDHGKRDVSDFPIATGTYYKVNYAPGTDISRYRNVPVPTSYMAYHSDYDFVASYDHGRRAGLLHVANHHLAPGKKQWTWGCGDFGKAWDRQLTDADGPYIELMCGVFTDNQPDFTWLNPYEEKRFSQYFMPYKTIGRIKNASIEGAINLEIENGKAYIAAYVTSPRKNLLLRLEERSGKILCEKRFDLTPAGAFEAHVDVDPSLKVDQLTLRLLDDAGRELLRYAPTTQTAPIPSPASPALPPADVESCEQLYLTGLHLEQYRHATLNPEDYYREALRRDSGDVRNNNALGLRLYRRGLFAEAEKHFRAAIATLTRRNPNPIDGEPSFNLGLTLRKQGKLDDAFDAFHKSIWNAAMSAPGHFELAKIEGIRKNFNSAADYCNQSLIANWHNHKARHLLIACLWRLGRFAEALREIDLELSIDPINYGALNERILIAREMGIPADAAAASDQLRELMRGDPHTHIELALDYAAAGLYSEASDVLARIVDANGNADAMVLYLDGWIRLRAGDAAAADKRFQAASGQSPKLVFPNRLDELLALESAVRRNPNDGLAWHLLGTLRYAKRDYDRAIADWESAERLMPSYPTVRRNLAIAYTNKRNDPRRALAMLERAFELDPSDARVLYELDQLRKKLNVPPRKRLELLESHDTLLTSRDDLFIERCTLLNLLGQYERVQSLLADRRFHPWEGGEGKVTGAYVASLLGIARDHFAQDDFQGAFDATERSRHFPDNLGEGKLPGALENDADYYAALALRGMGHESEATALLQRARIGLDEPKSAMYYNDQPPHMFFYQGLAARELGLIDEATDRFRQLIAFGQSHLHDNAKIDFFAVSLPEFMIFDEDLNLRNKIHCHHMIALGHLGLNELHEAKSQLEAVISLDASHQGAAAQLRLLERQHLAASK